MQLHHAGDWLGKSSLKLPIMLKKPWEFLTEIHLRSTGCRLPYNVGSHNVTCHPTQVNTLRLNLSQWTLVLDLPTPEGWKAWVDLGALITPGPGVEPMTARSEVWRPNHCTTKTLVSSGTINLTKLNLTVAFCVLAYDAVILMCWKMLNVYNCDCVGRQQVSPQVTSRARFKIRRCKIRPSQVPLHSLLIPLLNTWPVQVARLLNWAKTGKQARLLSSKNQDCSS